MAREIVTLQFGNLSNYAGAHYWNLEDEQSVFSDSFDTTTSNAGPHTPELDPSIHWRVSETADKKTVCTPRCLFVDTKGSLGAVPESGTLLAERNPLTTTTSTWEGKTSVFPQSKVNKTDFIRALEQSDQPDIKEDVPLSEKFDSKQVRYWTDFLKTHLHPRNLYLLPGVHHEVTPFNHHPLGQDLYKTDVGEELFDRFRYLAEECDQLQGVHCLLDTNSAFGGLACALLQEVNEEYSSVPIITFGSSVKYSDNLDAGRSAINTALTTSCLAEYSTMFVPMTYRRFRPELFPSLSVNLDSFFEVSSVLGTAIHTATTPYRKSHNFTNMYNYCNTLTSTTAGNVFDLSTCYPIQDEFIDALAKTIGLGPRKLPLYNIKSENYFRLTGVSSRGRPELAPNAKRSVYSEWVAFRGRPQDVSSISKQLDGVGIKTSPENAFLKGVEHVLEASGCRLSHVSAMQTALPVPIPYPSCLPQVRVVKQQRFVKTNPLEIPALSHVHSTSSFHDDFLTLAGEVREARRGKVLKDQFIGAGLENDSFNELDGNMQTIADNYAVNT